MKERSENYLWNVVILKHLWFGKSAIIDIVKSFIKSLIMINDLMKQFTMSIISESNKFIFIFYILNVLIKYLVFAWITNNHLLFKQKHDIKWTH